MVQDVVNKLFSSCEKIMCDPGELMYFKKNLDLICDKKLNVTFEFPSCGKHHSTLATVSTVAAVTATVAE